MEEPTQEQIEAFREAERQRIEHALEQIDETVQTVEGQLSVAESAGDEKSAARLRKSLAKLARRRQETIDSDRSP